MRRAIAINEDLNGGVAANTLVAANILGDSAINFGNRETSGVGVTELFPEGSELLAVTAPGGVELDDGDGVLLQERLKVGVIEDMDGTMGYSGIKTNEGKGDEKSGEFHSKKK